MFYLSGDLYVVLRSCDNDCVPEPSLRIFNDYDEACSEAETLTFLEIDSWIQQNPERAKDNYRPDYLVYKVIPLTDAISDRINYVAESSYDEGLSSGNENGYDEGYQQGLEDGKQQSGAQ